MMRKKLGILIGLVIFVVLSSILIFWFYFSKPVPFPTNEQLVKEINSIFPEAEVDVIQETIPVDTRHVVVPFISNENDNGLSYWVWQRHKWMVATIDTKGEPKIWKINKKDPSSFHLVWNINPEDQLSSIRFYLIRDRGFQITEGIENYVPRVQMEKKVSLEEKSFGVMQLPVEWAGFMNSIIKVESAKQTDLFFNNSFPVHSMYFGWIPYAQGDKETFPEGSVNGNGYSNGNLDLEHMMILGIEDLGQK
jgi:hypothetical protein